MKRRNQRRRSTQRMLVNLDRDRGLDLSLFDWRLRVVSGAGEATKGVMQVTGEDQSKRRFSWDVGKFQRKKCHSRIRAKNKKNDLSNGFRILGGK
ncbi:hypothetical protein [Desulfoluna spongiiphila]|uniref:Uncharacterized protein n=1 Tax=Desulfoluna spongiiphila TaxID=419481 RepID=A0A1G5G187_9BACT|nr:hypothetical protein [Desulfoluna spongiiphila]SCY44940.1 hypothetical protein SAMN05216233_109121 [Desulfoluna spongiiphila]